MGGIYALAAQSTVLIYRGSGVLNFSAGGMAVVGAYGYAEARDVGCPALLGIVIGATAAGLTGALVQLLVMRPLRAASPLSRLVATLGVLTLLQGAAFLRYGDRQEFIEPILPTTTWEPVSGAAIGADRIYLLGIAAALTVMLWVIYRYTRFGLTTTAVAENERSTAALGRSPEAVATINWIAGGMLAGLAGILVVPITGLAVRPLALLGIAGLAAALVGGFTSFPLTLAGAIAIGVLESELTSNADWLPDVLTQPGWSKSVPFIAIIVVLLLRGRALPLRSHVIERLPAVGTGRLRLWPVAIAALVATTFIGSTHVNWVEALTTTLIGGIIGLSLVVVTGYAGQLSLAQYALAGMGAWIASGAIDNVNILPFDVNGLPFPVALIIGVLLTVPVGIAVALPALRTRGANLAIATLGLALVIERIVFDNSEYTGGFEGTVVPAPSLFGLDIGATAHPERYAIFCLAMLLLVAIAVTNLRRSRAGRRLVAVRANERAAASLGISVVGVKLYAFGLATAIASVGGVLLAFRARHVLFDQFNVFQSINVVVITVIGGVGYVLGGVLGASIAPGALGPFVIDELTDWQRFIPAVSGGVLILGLIKGPDGFAGNLAAISRRLTRHRDREAPPALPDVGPQPVAPKQLRVDRLTVRFGGVVALDNVSVTVNPGEVVGLIGPNGAGKTTLIDAVTGFVESSGGHVLLDDRAITALSPSRRATAGICRSFQSLELFEDLTVRDNLRTAAEPRDRLAYATGLLWPRDPELPSTAVAAVREFGLENDLELCPRELPYGRRRLVAIARAMAAHSSILLLDEPAAGLDEREIEELGRLIRRMVDEWGLGVLLVEHDVALVMSVCDRILALDFGTPLAEGTPEQIRHDPAVIAAYLGESDADGERPQPISVRREQASQARMQ